jgi:hypothetical protein
MSLWSYLGTDLSGSSTSSSAQVAQAMQTLAARSNTSGSSTSGTGQSSVLITIDAKRAAAAKADAGKDAATMISDVRKELDTQYTAAGKTHSADLTALSGRALSTIALNETNQFSRAEIAAAKEELRARDRQSVMGMINAGPLTAATLATYTRDLLTAREGMSSEEQKLRAANPNLR